MIEVEIRVLRYFLAVAQERNITRAAHQLFISQPTLSNQLADLEKELGAQLFIRGHRQITLTSEGQYLRARAAEIVSLVDQTSANIQANQVISGELSIGAGESVGMQRILDVASYLTQDYPDVKIHLFSGDAIETERKLSNGTLDFAVLMGERPLTNYNYLQLPETDQWGVVMPGDDLLTQKLAIKPKDLLGHPLLLSAQAIQARRFQEWWGNLGTKMKIIGTYNLVFNAKLLVSNHSAYLVTFNHLIDSPDLAFRPLTPKLLDNITLVWKKNAVQSKVAQLFVKRLRATFETDINLK